MKRRGDLFQRIIKAAVFLSIASGSAVVHPSFGQDKVLTVNASLDAFDRAIGFENTGVINGQLYKVSFFSASTSPFFSGEIVGTVRFKGNSYSAPILYDVYQDEVVIKHLSAGGNAWFVKLNKSDVDEFTLQDQVFRNVNGSFYEVLFDGEAFSVFARRTKFEQEKNRIATYEIRDVYYLVKGSRWSLITGPARLRSLLSNKDDKQKVSAFMRERHIRNKGFTGAEFGEVAAFIGTLPLKK